jgi:hypothetical protein
MTNTLARAEIAHRTSSDEPRHCAGLTLGVAVNTCFKAIRCIDQSSACTTATSSTQPLPWRRRFNGRQI